MSKDILKKFIYQTTENNITNDCQYWEQYQDGICSFKDVEDDFDVFKLVDYVFRKTDSETCETNPFIKDLEKTLLQAICFYVCYELPEFLQDFDTVKKILKSNAQLNSIFKDLDEELKNDINYKHPAIDKYNFYKIVSGKLANIVFKNLKARLKDWK